MMIKKITVLLLAVILILSVASCSVDKANISDKIGSSENIVTKNETRIYNHFKDLLPKFKFDSEPVENYKEAISYSFSAKCSEKNFEKYVKKVQKAGFEINTVEANGYFTGYNADDYYVEMTLINETVSVYIKST